MLQSNIKRSRRQIASSTVIINVSLSVLLLLHINVPFFQGKRKKATTKKPIIVTYRAYKPFALWMIQKRNRNDKYQIWNVSGVARVKYRNVWKVNSQFNPETKHIWWPSAVIIFIIISTQKDKQRRKKSICWIHLGKKVHLCDWLFCI